MFFHMYPTWVLFIFTILTEECFCDWSCVEHLGQITWDCLSLVPIRRWVHFDLHAEHILRPDVVLWISLKCRDSIILLDIRVCRCCPCRLCTLPRTPIRTISDTCQNIPHTQWRSKSAGADKQRSSSSTKWPRSLSGGTRLIGLIALNVQIIFLLKFIDGFQCLKKTKNIFMSKSHGGDTVSRIFMPLHENYRFKSYYWFTDMSWREWHPLTWHSTPSCPATGLYNSGGLPDTRSWEPEFTAT